MMTGLLLSLQGYFSVLAAAVFFGIQYVPVKKHDIYDGTVFQWFMCSGILFTGIMLGTLSAGAVPRVAFIDLLGGMFWTAQNMLLMPVVKLLGLGLGFAIYSVTNVLSGYLIGRFGLFGNVPDPGHIPWLRDSGAACLVLSIAVMVSIQPDSDSEDEPIGPQACSAISVLSQTSLGEKEWHKSNNCSTLSVSETPAGSKWNPGGDNSCCLETPLVPAEKMPWPQASNGEVSPLVWERLESLLQGRGLKVMGIMLVMCAGFLNAMSAMPFNWWLAINPSLPKGSFVFAQALGTWMVSTTLYLVFATGRQMFKYASPPHTCIRPAFLAGFFWSLGFVFMCKAIDGLGFTAGFTFVSVLPVAVSSIISLCWFREITGTKNICLFLLCFLIQSIGIVCIALGSH